MCYLYFGTSSRASLCGKPEWRGPRAHRRSDRKGVGAPVTIYDLEVSSPGFGLTRLWGAVRFKDGGTGAKQELPVVIFPALMCEDGNFTKPWKVLALEGNPELGDMSGGVYRLMVRGAIPFHRPRAWNILNTGSGRWAPRGKVPNLRRPRWI